MKITKIYIMVMILAFFWCLIIFVPPLAAINSGGDDPLARAAYLFFSPICHQLDSHSFHMFGSKLAVCMRCSSVYFGFFLGGLLAPWVKNNKSRTNAKLWFFASAPMVADVLLDILKIHEATSITRIATGLLFGISAAIILMPIIVEAVNLFYTKSFTFRRSYSWIKNLIN